MSFGQCSVRRAVLAGLVWLGATTPLAGQTRLDQVEELSALGRTEEARVLLLEWWDGGRDNASRRDLQRALWLRGRLTVDPVQAELDFQRLVVLYPSGPFTPQALFRLAQSSHAQGDMDGATRHVATLTRDYPTSPVRSDAEAWLRGAGQPQPMIRPPSDAGAAVVDLASSSDVPDAPNASDARTDREVVSDGDGTAGSDVAEVPEADPVDAQLPQGWMVQFGAFSEEGRALALHEDLMDAGLDARLVRVEGSAFWHVRIGRFGNRVDANTQLEAVMEQGFSAAIVRDERAERVVVRR